MRRRRNHRYAKSLIMENTVTSWQGKKRKRRKEQKTIEVKEVRLSPNIDSNDLNTKIASARKFIEKGNKVKVTLRFRGREMAHVQSSRHILDEFAKALEDIALVDKPAKMEGRSMAMFLTEKRSYERRVKIERPEPEGYSR